MAKYNQSKSEAKKSGTARVKISGGSSGSSKSKSSKVPKSKFDQKKATAEYTKLADAIYNPQVTALQNQQTYNTQLAERQKVTTRGQFAELLDKTIETLNARGAFFGGGAVKQENRVNTDQTNALTDIDMATTNANLGVSTAIGELQGRRAEYIASGVNSSQSSAYNQFQDQLQNYFKMKDYDIAEKNAAADRELELLKLNKPKAAAKPAKPIFFIDEKGNTKALPPGQYIGGLGAYNKGLGSGDDETVY